MYNGIPLKKELYVLWKKIGIPKKSIYKHLHFKSDFQVYVDREHFFRMHHYGFEIENEIFWNGVYNGWEKVSLELWGELCVVHKSIMDVGANTGIYTLLTKTLNPAAKVWAFEPIERVYGRLLYNINLNNYKVNCVRKALSNIDGNAIVYDKDTPHTYSVTVNKDISEDKTTSIPTEIETIRLDTYIEQQGVEFIDLMKIDVETHEAEVLQGMGAYLNKFQPTLLIEILNEEVAEQVSKLISGIDYEFYNIDENGAVRKVNELGKSDFYNFLICKNEVASGLSTLRKYQV